MDSNRASIRNSYRPAPGGRRTPVSSQECIAVRVQCPAQPVIVDNDCKRIG